VYSFSWSFSSDTYREKTSDTYREKTLDRILMSDKRKASRKWIRYFQQFLNFVPPKIFPSYKFSTLRSEPTSKKDLHSQAWDLLPFTLKMSFAKSISKPDQVWTMHCINRIIIIIIKHHYNHWQYIWKSTLPYSRNC